MEATGDAKTAPLTHQLRAFKLTITPEPFSRAPMTIHGAQRSATFALNIIIMTMRRVALRQTSHAPALIRSLPFVVSSGFRGRVDLCQSTWGHKPTGCVFSSKPRVTPAPPSTISRTTKKGSGPTIYPLTFRPHTRSC